MKKLLGFLSGIGLLLMFGMGASFVLDKPSIVEVVVASLVEGVALILAIWYAKKQGFFADEEPLFFWKRLAYVLLFYMMLRAIGDIGHWLMAMQGKIVTDNSALIDSISRQIPIFYDVFSRVITSPVVEEIIFRGIIPRILFPKHQIVGLIVSAIIFGFLHGVATVGEAVIYIGGGLVFGLAYYRKKSVTDSILVHIVANLLALIN
ncbi:CPBP family intramembrane glutamic endopeptidase [Streptococcus ovis]|uniref:CPBP family intramembrane glutamic endopeptidase n=1 Tax=Streptococcus ovis TaxID=82806 RepID=UPI000370BC9F|nr:CPBP family intramembrane glutamic endopeptidase [Streptococcus ovis]